MHALRVFVTLSATLLVSAEIYVTQPASGSSCSGGKPCTVSWVDNGVPPLLSSIGTVKVGLYTGDLQLLQTIVPVDVATSHSLTFTPDSKAGPNAGNYYIAFISTDGKYTGYSPDFALDSMTGSSTPSNSSTSTLYPSSLSSPSVPPSGSSTGSSASGASSTSATGTGKPTTTATVTTVSGTSSAPPQTTSGSGTSTVGSSGSSSSVTTSSTSAFPTTPTVTPSSAAVATGPATGFVWTLLAALGFVLF